MVQDESLCNEASSRQSMKCSTGGRKQLDITTQTVPQRMSGRKESVQDTGLQRVRHQRRIASGLAESHRRQNQPRFVVVLLDDVSESIRFNQIRESFIRTFLNS